MSTEGECPFDFINDFERWFSYHKQIIFDHLTHEQAMQNIRMRDSGWRLVNGCKYGGWAYNGWMKTKTKENQHAGQPQ